MQPVVALRLYGRARDAEVVSRCCTARVCNVFCMHLVLLLFSIFCQCLAAALRPLMSHTSGHAGLLDGWHAPKHLPGSFLYTYIHAYVHIFMVIMMVTVLVRAVLTVRIHGIEALMFSPI